MHMHFQSFHNSHLCQGPLPLRELLLLLQQLCLTCRE
jgi:hypothetical protein